MCALVSAILALILSSRSLILLWSLLASSASSISSAVSPRSSPQLQPSSPIEKEREGPRRPEIALGVRHDPCRPLFRLRVLLHQQRRPARSHVVHASQNGRLDPVRRIVAASLAGVADHQHRHAAIGGEPGQGFHHLADRHGLMPVHPGGGERRQGVDDHQTGDRAVLTPSLKTRSSSPSVPSLIDSVSRESASG